MDFDGAIQAHVEWKLKLSTYIRKPDGSLKWDTVSKDNQCALGKWIYSEGSAFAKLPEFAELKKVHADFHRVAGEIIRKADSGQKIADDVALGADSEYAKVSNRVVQLIRMMRSKSAA